MRLLITVQYYILKKKTMMLHTNNIWNQQIRKQYSYKIIIYVKIELLYQKPNKWSDYTPLFHIYQINAVHLNSDTVLWQYLNVFVKKNILFSEFRELSDAKQWTVITIAIQSDISGTFLSWRNILSKVQQTIPSYSLVYSEIERYYILKRRLSFTYTSSRGPYQATLLFWTRNE